MIPNMQEVLVATAGKVATVTLDCPPVNALTMARYRRIAEVFDALSQRDDVHCAIFTAAGTRAFCAGLDLQEFLASTVEDDAARAATVRKTFAALRAIREQQGLSISDQAERTGMDRAMISRLETGQVDNPTISTMSRYARALGKRVVVSLVDEKK